MIRKLLIGAAVAALLPAAAGAQTFNLSDAYNNTSGRFTLGFGTGTSVTPYNSTTTSCFGVAGFSCRSFAPVGSTSSNADVYLPAIGYNTTGSPLNVVDAVTVPGFSLFLHPGDEALNSDSIIRFTSPTAGQYAVSGSFNRLDASGNGNGTINSIYSDAIGPVSLFSTNAGTRTSSFNLTFNLAAGQSIYFAVNNAGNFQYDSTGLSGTIAAVPESATWGMMILGFGVMGAAMRRRRTTVAFA